MAKYNLTTTHDCDCRANFVIELAFQQEEATDAESIVTMAETARVELIVPAYALAEPYETLVRRKKERSDILQRLRAELNQLARSREYANLPGTSTSVTQALAASAQLQAEGLDRTVRRFMRCGKIIPLTSEVMASALDAQLTFKLQPQDAIVFATVDRYLEQSAAGEKLFVNKNQRDFLTLEIESRLAGLGCKLMPKICAAKSYIVHRLNKIAPAS